MCVCFTPKLIYHVNKLSIYVYKRSMAMCMLTSWVCMSVSWGIYVRCYSYILKIPFNKKKIYNTRYHSIVIYVLSYYLWLMGDVVKYPNNREFKNYMDGAPSTDGEFKVHMLQSLAIKENIQSSAIKQNIQSSYVTKFCY